MNEVITYSTRTDVLSLLCILHQVIGNNLCVLTTTPIEAHIDPFKGILKTYYISHLEKYSLKKLLKVFQIQSREICSKPIAEYPFFLGIIIKIKEFGAVSSACEANPYELLKHYFSLSFQRANYHIEDEMVKRFSRNVYNDYKKHHMVNRCFPNMDRLFPTRQDRLLGELLVSMKILKRGQGKEVSFYHDWYWRFFMALGCKNGKGMEYWKHFTVLSRGRGALSGVPNPLLIAEDAHLAPVMAMYLSGTPDQLQSFVGHYTRFCHNMGYNEQLTLLEYIADNFLELLYPPRALSGYDPPCLSHGILDDFVMFHKEKEDFRMKLFLVKVSAYCNLETQKIILEKIFQGESDWLKKRLLDSYGMIQDGNLLFQKALNYTFTCFKKDKEDSRIFLLELQIKKYFLTQYISELYDNQTFYKSLFQGMEGSIGKRFCSFVQFRYQDIAVTWGLYLCFLGMFVANMVLLWNQVLLNRKNVLFLAIKLVGFLIFAGSFKAWMVQCKYAEDVYLEIFGKSSRWMTVGELVKMLAQNKKFCFFKGFFKAAGNGSLGEFLPVLLDWVRVRPSVVILFSMLLLLLWPQSIAPWFQWYHCILAAILMVGLWIPVTDYMYLGIAEKCRAAHRGKFIHAGCWILALKSFLLISAILSAGAIFTMSSANFGIKSVTALVFSFIVVTTVCYIGSSAKEKMTRDCQLLEAVSQRGDSNNVADLALFSEFQTSEGQKRYLKMVRQNFLVDDRWLKACKSESVAELFHEFGILYCEDSPFGQ